MPKLLLLLGDQLDQHQSALEALNKNQDHILMAELADEAAYVPHNKIKIALIFSAMRHFANALDKAGYQVIYYDYLQTTKAGLHSVSQLVRHQLQQSDYNAFHYVEPEEHRLDSELGNLEQELPLTVRSLSGSNFIFTREQMLDWFSGRKSPRMEHYYRWARQHTGLLMEGKQPVGGQYNYDKQNRQPWKDTLQPPSVLAFTPDEITQQVLELVQEKFPDNPGRLDNFSLAVTSSEARQALDDFIHHRLSAFGDFQDALADNTNTAFHSLLSAYINIGLLNPRQVCSAAVKAYENGQAPLNAVEGFVRQILGWREYIRGLYWLCGPQYASKNALNAYEPLPDWFWNGNTHMRCISQAVKSSLDQAYAHHIQRLMVIGNFALLSALDVKQVCRWYLAVYMDAFEWVELPNTLGMALYADDGFVASKPYAASGRYINKMGNHCKHCVYNVNQATGNKACPFNALYWHFIHRHQHRFSNNPRMSLMLSQWHKKPAEDQHALLEWSEHLLSNMNAL
ncbi:cryptochrome/photolyase family protein [Lacimicrobium alkaliphilum]|uniref:(6-4) photolyase n=1 Tax=Lacimicrobium alkaliphilum TaxID=1526571 RepID=A0ABQ1RFW9_9ALTE|nr:cryptochrome/photolyase family protein [Lacimicrobium alkaliphilum]GGD69162.1 (6-4) photolyase [Lacimicrobium alkaliphilum]